jgi:hypothetical protein
MVAITYPIVVIPEVISPVRIFYLAVSFQVPYYS